MKSIRNILFLCRDEYSFNPLFEIILKHEIRDDLFLSTAKLCVDSAELRNPRMDSKEGKLAAPELISALAVVGFPTTDYCSKNIDLHPGLINWADLILVPRLSEEDLACTFSQEAWRKTIEIECYCGKDMTGNHSLNKMSYPKTQDDYISLATRFKELLPDLINKIKDSYTGARIVKGVAMNRKTTFSNVTVIGRASVIKRGHDLLNFAKDNILVVDRLGAVLKHDIDQEVAKSIIKKFAETPDFYKDKTPEIQDRIKHLEMAMKGITMTPINQKIFPDGDNAINVIVKNARAIICCRGYHVNEFKSSPYPIPYISSCVGATKLIKDNQLLVMDTGRGEVYDAALLQAG